MDEMNRRFLEGILNSCWAEESLQVAAYNVLYRSDYTPTDKELATLIAAQLVGWRRPPPASSPPPAAPA
jgi:hypothetical protein